MIVKYFEIHKINFNDQNIILFYGKNNGLKNEITNKLVGNKNEVFNYDEKEVLENDYNFIEKLATRSLFEEEKIIIIKRATDKILKIIEAINSKNLGELIIIINSDNLEKKSKLRSLFEKDKKLVCVPFYPDNEQTLSKLAYNF